MPSISWLDHHPAAYWIGAALGTGTFLAWVITGLRAGCRSPGRDDPPDRAAGAILALAAILATWRWPMWFYPGSFNPDESQLVAGAQALAVDPVFWRSVDGGTAGPLNFYALLWVRAMGLSASFLTARLTGLMFVACSLFFSYRLLRLFFPAGPSRLILVPPTLFFAIVTQDDFVHYSTEHLSLFCLSVGTFLLVRYRQSLGGGRGGWWLGGACLGLLPWTKLQALPLAAAVVVWVLATPGQVLRRPAPARIREAIELLGALLLPTLVGLGLVAATGVGAIFFSNYVQQNLHYVSAGMTATTIWNVTIESLNRTWHFQACFAAPLIVAVVGSLWRGRQRGIWALGFLLFVSGVVAVATPRRPYPHYLLFMILPLTCWSGAVVGAWWERWGTRSGRCILAGFWLAVGALVPIAVRSTKPVPEMVARWTEYRTRPLTAAGSIVVALTQPGDSLGLWGWMTDFNVETGRRQATRQANSFLCLQPNPQIDLHRARYLADLQRNRPAVFIDAVGPTADFFHDRNVQGHECFPALAEFLRRNYVEFVDVDYARIYLRADRSAAGALPGSRVQQLIAGGRKVRGKPPLEAVSLEQASLPPKVIDRRAVRMMLPRAEIGWTLRGTEREFHFEIGYDPRAFLEGSGNGTLFILELTTPGSVTYAIYQRLLDPSNRLHDRGIVAEQVVLPPVPAGTRLTLRTEPGPEQNDVWDWAFLASAAFDHGTLFHATQFPGFNRLPRTVTAHVTYLETESDQPVLVLHAPAAMTFPLRGGERLVTLDYGLRSGAYEGDGRTDGAALHLRLRSPSNADVTLLRRMLDPVQALADRGRQRLSIALPEGLAAGTELVIDLDSGPAGSSAWDWTYLANLQIR